MAMLCRLYELKDITMFRQKWVPLVSDIVYKGTIFNWGAILSGNMKSTLATAKDEDTQVIENFYISSYLMDACYTHNHFQKMKWTWSCREASIHVYCNILWESKYKSNYKNICNDLLLPLHCLLTGRQAFCMNENARVTLS